MRELLESGVHFGHQTRRWNPKMKPYLFGVKSGIHILDLQTTAKALNRALNAIRQMASEGKSIMFVSTKAQTRELLPELIRPTGMPFVVTRWPGGFLTNFQTMKKRIKYRTQIEKELTDPAITRRLTKKEILMQQRELDALNVVFAGTKELLTLPDAVFVVDTVHDHIAVLEARRIGAVVFSFIDSNSDPAEVDFPIPANDDAVKSISLILTLVVEAIRDGQGLRSEPAPAARATAPAVKRPIDAIQVPADVVAEKDAPKAAPRRAPRKTA